MHADGTTPQSQPTEKSIRISLAKLTVWINENKISNKCPFCETSEWTVPQNDTILGCALPWGDGKGDMFMTGMPVIVLVCNKCFFVRPMALDRGLREIITEEIDNATQ